MVLELMSSALFINGVFEETLAEILVAQTKAPFGTFFLQPYASDKIKLLADAAPSPENPVDLYISITSSLDLVSFRARVVGWRDKRTIPDAEIAALSELIRATQPTEKAIYRFIENDKKLCVNLITISNLARLTERIPVSCFVKISDQLPLKRRTRSGGWSPVFVRPEWLGGSFTSLAEDETKVLNRKVAKSLEDSSAARRKRLETAAKKPETIQVLARAFRRNADVIAEVLSRAKGECERCESEAPFLKASDGLPFLEVHHRVLLSQGGDDTVENALALCPNCHRKLHFGYPDVKA